MSWACLKPLLQTDVSSHKLAYTCGSPHYVSIDMTSQSSSSCRAVLFDNLDTAKTHGLDMSNVSSHDVTSQVEFGL